MEVSAKRARLRVRDAVDALLCVEGEVEVGVGVCDGAAAVGDETLGVVDLIDERSLAAGRDQVFYEVGLIVIEAPLREVADEGGTGCVLRDCRRNSA